MRTNVALETVLVRFVMFESLRPVEVAITMTATKSLDVAVRQQVSFELIRSRKLAHAAQVTAKWALEPFRQIMDQHVPSQPVFSLESSRAMLPIQI